MPDPSDEHDHLAWLLTAILLKLNQGARVIPDELAGICKPGRTNRSAR